MTPLMPDRECWASTIGLFILNFGTLDLHVQDYLENNLSHEEFCKFKDRHFRDRVERIRNHAGGLTFSGDKREAFEKLFNRLEPIRELRNHIAHGLLRIEPSAETKSATVTLSLPRDLSETSEPAARHLSFAELSKVSKDLTDWIEDFKEWTGDWVTDVDMRF